MSIRLYLWLPLAALVTQCLLGSAVAQINPGHGNLGTPILRPIKVEAVKGVATEIRLTSEVISPNSIVEYILREGPAQGTLDIIVSDPENRSQATVIYTPDRNAADEDRFTITARYHDLVGQKGLYAKNGEVIISLSEAEPKIVVTPMTDFGRVMLGQEVTRQVFLENQGNAVFSKQIELAEPWYFVTPSNGFLKIAEGDSLSVTLGFRPKEAERTKFDVQFHPNEGGTIRLEATAYTPFAVPAEGALTYEARSRTRSIELPIETFAQDPITVEVVAPSRVQISPGKEVTYFPNEKGQITVVLPAQDVREFSGELNVVFDNYSQTVLLKSAATPAYISMSSPDLDGDKIDFGKLERGQKVQKTLYLGNLGGQPGEASVQIEEPFLANTGVLPGESLVIPAESTHAITISLSAPKNIGGIFRKKLTIMGNSRPQEIELIAHIEEPKLESIPILPTSKEIATGMSSKSSAGTPRELPPHLQKMSVETLEKLRSPTGFITIDGYRRDYASHVPTIADVFVREITPTSITLNWPIPIPRHDKFEVEIRGWQKDKNQMLRSVWFPYPDVEYAFEDETVVAIVKGLAPHTNYETRILTINTRGKASQPLLVNPINTAMPMDWTWIYVGFAVFLLGGLIWLGRNLYLRLTAEKFPGETLF